VKTYAINYKSYYHELSDWCCDYVRARDKRAALRQFARRHHISIPKDYNVHWEWRDGDWLYVFRFIHQATLQTCPNCGGSGHIAITNGTTST